MARRKDFSNPSRGALSDEEVKLPLPVVRHIAHKHGLSFRLNQWTNIHELNGEEITDAHYHRIEQIAQEELGLTLPKEKVLDAMLILTREHLYNPVLEYLTALSWDDSDAISALADVLGIREELERTLLRKFLIGAVARAFAPGSQFDAVLVLVGEQGVGKSTALRALCPRREWFCDGFHNIRDKDDLMKLRRAWVVEWAELSAVKKADLEPLKAFISVREDEYRDPYARFSQKHLRHNVFAATTNEDTFLRDPTGNRRFWPIRITRTQQDRIDIRAIERLRPAVWAQARALYEAGELVYLSAEEERRLTEQHEQYREGDVWEPLVREWAPSRHKFTTAEALEHAVRVPPDRQDWRFQHRMGAILRQLDFNQQPAKRPDFTKPQRCWYNPDPPACPLPNDRPTGRPNVAVGEVPVRVGYFPITEGGYDAPVVRH